MKNIVFLFYLIALSPPLLKSNIFLYYLIMVRNIRIDDAKYIAAICESTLNHKTSIKIIEERIEELINNSNYFIAVYDDGKASAFIQAEEYTILYGEKGWNIISLAVSEDKQNKGYGKALINALENHCLNNGGSFIRLNSRIERENAHGFYAHLGYKCDKTQKRFIKYLK